MGVSLVKFRPSVSLVKAYRRSGDPRVSLVKAYRRSGDPRVSLVKGVNA